MKFLIFVLILSLFNGVTANEKRAIKTSVKAIIKYPFAKQAEKLIRKKVKRYTLAHYMFWVGERYLKGKIKKNVWKDENSKISSEFVFRPDQQIILNWSLNF